MARPSKIHAVITDGETGEEIAVTEAILRALRAGAYVEDAAEAAGVAKGTVFKWIARGGEFSDVELEDVPEAERPYVEFRAAVEKARANAVVFNLALVRKAAQNGSWQAAAWWLERTRPEKFGRRIKIETEEERTPAPVDKLTAKEAQASFEAANLPEGFEPADILPTVDE